MEARERLLAELARHIRDRRVLAALARIPREQFVEPALAHLAYVDEALPIASGQTISQPFIVALMSEALELTGTERVLEIGTGSGYQTAVLAELATEVVSVERLASLAEPARELLEALGYRNIEFEVGDGSLGWPARAPYDAILVTAAAPRPPAPLLAQLGTRGRLVVPSGESWEQELLQIRRTAEGMVQRSLGRCRFVPLIGAAAWPEGTGGGGSPLPVGEG
jgi:protein-L-isoaspartate(D-aspartate) O-methyltransferase